MDSDETTVSIASILVPDGLVDLLITNGTSTVIKDDLSQQYSYNHNDALRPPPEVLNGGPSPALWELRDRKKRSASYNHNDVLRPPPGILNVALRNFMGAAREKTLPKAVYLKTIVWYDQSLLQKFNGDHCKTKLWISKVVELAKPRLALPSLKVRINLIVEDVRESKLTLKATNSNLNMLTRKSNEIDNKDRLNSYFCYDLLNGRDTVGIAWLGTACDKNGWAVNINEYYTNTHSELNSARTFVHEIGHNIGME